MITHQQVRFDQLSRWDAFWLRRAHVIASMSKDPSTKAGAVLAVQRRMLGEGYNGFPQLIEDREEWLADRSIKYPLIIHAEMNALLQAMNHGAAAFISASTLYTTLVPCGECTKMMVAQGVRRYVYVERQAQDPTSSYQANSAPMDFVLDRLSKPVQILHVRDLEDSLQAENKAGKK